MNNTKFIKIEVLQASNAKVLAINDIRVSPEKGYGIMTPVASFELGIEDVLNAMNYAPVKHGRWIEIDQYHFKCSECGAREHVKFYPLDEHKFCWHCGAQMGGD